jgi:hypothetical protein
MKPGMAALKPFMALAGPYGQAGALGATALGYGKRGRKPRGAGFFEDFGTGFNMVMKPGMAALKPFMALAGPYGQAGALGATALGYGKRGRKPRGGNIDFNNLMNLGKQYAPIAKMGLSQFGGKEGKDIANLMSAFGFGKRSGGRRSGGERGKIVSAVMDQRGVSLPEASKIVKAEGLY